MHSSRGRQYSISSETDSIFSYTSAGSTATASTMMSNPSIGNTFVAQNSLPCEFVGYGGCDTTFDVNDVDSWIEHIASEHMRNKLPKKAFCWYCDEFEFDSRDVNGDKRANFENRMWHIRNHIVYEGRTPHNIRPDHYLNKHLYEHHLIGEESYNSVRRYSEIWQPSYLVDSHAPPEDWGVPESSRSQMIRANTRDEERSIRKHKNRRNKDSSRR
ncbi:hypothetical protein F5Y08DRAFT_208124 [Xylaria arbuscula]|nr:hypothetical protein F5Y08DRAFT_208124 [Xylaria arbuscula]